MSADGELLAMAAKAAGEPYTLANFAEPGEFEDGWGMVVDMASFWNPLTNYGDTLRLAAKIGGQISIGRAYCRCRWISEPIRQGDVLGALCRAVVRSAAATGRRLP